MSWILAPPNEISLDYALPTKYSWEYELAGEVCLLSDGQCRRMYGYLINLKKAQTLHAAIDQLGIDVVVVIYSPDKSPLYEIDSPENDWGREYIEIRATQAGI